MSRLNIEQEISLDDIISNSLDIYKREIQLTKKGNNYLGLCPLHGEKSPSFNVSDKSPYFFKCFGCSKSGNIITFLKERYNLDFKGVLEYIKSNNFVLAPIQQKPVNFINKTYKDDVIIDFTDVPFSKKGHEYWNSYELNEDFLKKNNVFQVGKYAINKKLITHQDDRVIFAYLASDERVKLLQIGNEVKKSEKWKTNVKADYLWYYEDYVKNQCNNLIVSKSVKDSLVLKYINRCSIAVQSENAKPIIDNCIDRIENITKNIYVGFGSDKQAKEQSHILTKATGWKHINTKDKYLDKYQINDFAELVKIYNMKKLDNELKEKNL